MKRRKLLMVTWHDAIHTTHGWVDSMAFKHIDDLVHSVGWLLRKDKKSITLAQTDGIDSVANPLQIPMKMVQKITSLKGTR